MDSLSPVSNGLSPVSNGLSPEAIEELIINPDNSGDSGHTGEKNDMLLEKENLHCNNQDNNTKGSPNTLTTVTTVTKEYSTELNNITSNTVSQSVYRLYKGDDKWACNNCTTTEDKWYMLQHKCKMNRK